MTDVLNNLIYNLKVIKKNQIAEVNDPKYRKYYLYIMD